MSGGLLDMLTQKMGYLTQRQAVIADNISNANTPGFRPNDLESFDKVLQKTSSNVVGGASGDMKMVATNSMHLGGTHGVQAAYKASSEKDLYEVKPSGNGVVLEQQMTELAKNYTDYSTVTSLYHKTVSMIKTALSRPS
jgi:flagellar basal-body rod protein FlgB